MRLGFGDGLDRKRAALRPEGAVPAGPGGRESPLFVRLLLALLAGRARRCAHPRASGAVWRTSRGRLVGTAGRGLFDLVGLFRVFQFHEVGDVEKGVALQADVDKCRLHAGRTRVTRPL